MVDILIIRNRFDLATEYTNWIGEGLKADLEGKGHSVTDLSDTDASPDKVYEWLRYDKRKTVKAVIALDHGGPDAFYGEESNQIAQVINKANAELLVKQVHVYTLACSTNANNGVGETAVDKGCFSWLGYTEPVYAMKSQSFKECIWSYIEAMAEGKTIEECEQALRQAYTARAGQSPYYQYNLDRLLLRKRFDNMTINSHCRREEVEVERYYARWNPIDHNGYVRIFWDGGSKGFGSITDPSEFYTMVDLMRNEKPVFWDERRNNLYASNEPVGEGE